MTETQALYEALGVLTNAELTEAVASIIQREIPRIEALELRQNLVESPVMLRLAEAAERQATALETLAECVKPASDNSDFKYLATATVVHRAQS